MDTDNLSLRAVADQLRLNTTLNSSEVSGILKREVTRNLYNDPRINEMIVNGTIEEMREELNAASKLREVFVYQKLSKDDQDKLRKSFCVFNLNFTRATDCSGHPFWRAHRFLSEQKLLLSAGITKFSKPTKGFDAIYKDVGGNPCTHLSRKEFYVHTCAPLLSNNDDKRISVYKEKLRRLSKKFLNPAAELHLNSDRRVICHNKSQNCHIKAEVLIFLHSVYDMSNSDIANAMSSANALSGFGCFHFSPIVMYQDSGHISNGMWFSKYMSNGRLRIRFFYENDNQEGYDHDWNCYVSFLRTFRIRSSDNKFYNVQFDTTENDTVFFSIRRCINGTIPLSRPFRVITNPELEDKYIIYYWRWETLNPGTSCFSHMRPIRLIVPKKLYNKLIAFADTLPESKFTVKNILVAANSFNTREIISGQSVGVIDPIDPDTLKHLAHLVFLLVYISNYECSKALSAILSDEEYVREMSDKGFITRLFAPKRFATNEIVDRMYDLSLKPGECLSTRILKKVCKFFSEMVSVDRLYSVVVKTKLVQFVTIETELKSLFVSDIDFAEGFTSDNPTISGVDLNKLRDAYLENIPVEDNPVYSFDKSAQAYTCKCQFELVPNFSENNCIFASIISSCIFSGSINELKNRLLSSKFLNLMIDKNNIINILTNDDVPGNLDIFILFSLEFSVAVCLHCFNSTYTFGDFDKTLHFYIDSLHCSLLRRVYQYTVDKYSVSDRYDMSDSVSLRSPIIKQKKTLKKFYSSAMQFYKSFDRNGYICHNSYQLFELSKMFILNLDKSLCVGGNGGDVQFLLSEDSSRVVYHIAHDTNIKGYKYFNIRNRSGNHLISDLSDIEFLVDSIRIREPDGLNFVFLNYSYISDEIQKDKPGSSFFQHFINQLILGLSLLSVNGSMCIRIYDFDSKHVPYINSLINCFSDIHFIRLRTSNIFHNSVNIFFENYIPTTGMISKLLNSSITSTELLTISFNILQDYIGFRNHLLDIAEFLYKYSDSVVNVNSDYEELVSLVINEMPKNCINFELTPRKKFFVSTSKFDQDKIITKLDSRAFPKLNGFILSSACKSEVSHPISPPVRNIIPLAVPTTTESDSFVNNKECDTKDENPDDKILNCMRECLELTKYSLSCQISNHHRVLKKLVRLPLFSNLLNEENGGYSLIRYSSDSLKLITGKSSDINRYNKFFFNNSFHPVSKISKILSDGDRFLFSDYCEVAIDDDLIKSYSKISINQFKIPSDSSIIQAAPGCGKTTYILNNVNFESNKYTVLLATREGRNDFISRYERKYDVVLDDSQRRYIRTVASYIVNCDDIMHTDVLYIDEALMSHPGQLLYAIALCKPTVVRFLGDMLQIPYVNRTPNFKTKYDKLIEFVEVSKTLYVSFRCPADVAYRLNPHYFDFNSKFGFSHGMHSINHQLNSCKFVRIKNDTSFPHDKNIQYLTFTQSEKQKLLNHNLKVSTVHEFQGKEAPVIYVVRLNPYPQDEIFLRFNYALVAITRHTKEMVYYTRVSTDALSKLIAVDGKIVKSIAPEDDIKTVICKTAGSAFEIMRYDYTCDLSTINFTTTPLHIISGHKLYFVPKYGFKDDCYLKPTIMEKRVHYRFDGKFYSFFCISSNSSNQNHNLVSIKQSLKILSSLCLNFNITRLFVSGSVIKDIDRSVLGYSLFKHLPVKCTLSTSKFVQDLPVEVFDLMCVNGLNSLQNQVVDKYEHFDNSNREENDHILFEFNLLHAQNFVNSFFGDISFVDQTSDSWQVQNSDIDLELGHIRFCPIKGIDLPKHYDCVRPSLFTPKPMTRNVNRREIMLALEKRNRNVPFMNGIVDFESTAQEMLDKLVVRAFDKDKLLKYNSDPIAVSSYSIHSWLSNQPPSVKNLIVPQFCIHESAVNSYLFSIKRQPKPNLTIDATSSYLALQTIVYHEKPINAIFCSIFRELKFRLMNVLRKNLKIFCDMSTKDFEDLLNKDIPYTSDFDFLERLEIDISKYDKSQREVALIFECLVMKFFGVSEYFVTLWYNAHILTEVYDRCSALKAFIAYQRKSGDASTFIGNTLFLIAVICDLVPLDQLLMGLFSGDDSLLIGYNLSKYKDTQHFALKFNLEIKFLNFHYSYFCSKFLIPVNSKWAFIADPLKLLTKIGRNDLVNFNHVEEYRISVGDTVKQFKSFNVCVQVAKALKERYQISQDHTLFLMSLPSLSLQSNFNMLYYISPSDRIDNSICFNKNFD
nr:RNA-dependent RNA polymerase [ssRNA positive-strand virus sp.]